jgi:hypothetical protein
MVEANDATIQMGGAIFISANSVSLDTSGALVAVADTVQANNTTIGVLFAGTVEGNPEIKVDARRAVAIGAAAIVALMVVKRIFSRG